MKKLMCLFLAVLMLASMLVGCGSKPQEAEPEAAPEKEAEVETNDPAEEPAPEEEAAEPVTLKMWIWNPSADQFAPVIEAYEKDHPNVKIELTVMESLTYQQKLPVALATGAEELDLIGVQLGAMVGQIETYMEPLEPLLAEVMPDWTEKYNQADAELLRNQISDKTLKFLCMGKMGSMMGFYNADIFNELGLEIPQTIEEYQTVVETIREKRPDVMPVAFDGKDAWFMDEMVDTVLAQNGTYYNEWRYNGAPYDSEEMVKAYTDFKKFYDMGIFTEDVMDLDYAGAADKFLSGQAATYFQGTWDAGLLSESFRQGLGATVGNVGAFALPVADPENGKQALRAFPDIGVAVTNTSAHKKEAADFLAYLIMGDGMTQLGKTFMFMPSKSDFVLDEALLTTPEAKEGFALIQKLCAEADSDRNNVSSFADVAGAGVQRVVLGQSTPEEEVAAMGAEWASGKYGG